jgi:hypothetical protein
MNKINPKELFFNYNCDIQAILKDKSLKIDNDVLKDIEDNKDKYIDEYHKIKLETIKKCDYIEIILNEITKYRISCFNYDDVYKLVDTLYYIIVEKLIFDDMLFIVYYGIFLFDKEGMTHKDNFKEDNLLLYIKNNYKDYQYKLSKIEEVISRDVTSSPLKDIIEKKIKEIEAN